MQTLVRQVTAQGGRLPGAFLGRTGVPGGAWGPPELCPDGVGLWGRQGGPKL